MQAGIGIGGRVRSAGTGGAMLLSTLSTLASNLFAVGGVAFGAEAVVQLLVAFGLGGGEAGFGIDCVGVAGVVVFAFVHEGFAGFEEEGGHGCVEVGSCEAPGKPSD